MTAKLWIGSHPAPDVVGTDYDHAYLVYDPDGDPTSGDELVFRGGPNSPGDLHITIEDWVPIAASDDALGSDDPLTDRNYTELASGTDATNKMNALAAWAEDFGAPDVNGKIATDIRYTFPLHIGDPTAPPIPALNSNTVFNSALNHIGVDATSNTPRIDGDPLNPRMNPNTFAGLENHISGGNATVPLDNSQNRVVLSQGGDTTYEIDTNSFATGQIHIVEDNDPGTLDKIVINNLDVGDLTFARMPNGDLQIYFPWDAPNHPSVVVHNQWDHDGLPRINTVHVVPSVGSPSVLPLNDPHDFPLTTPEPVPGWVPAAYTPFNDSKPLASPLVLDLSSGHTGIDLTTFNASTTETFFDLRGTGYAVQTAWVSGDTGLLARDLDTNGLIDSVNELFGSPTVDGFAKLAELDSDHNLRIDQYDTDWSDLVVWVDADGDAVTDSGELHTLTSLNIASIDLAGVAASTSTIDGNPISHTSTFTFTSGATAAIADAWFVHDTMNSYSTADYTLDIRTLFLPDMRGFGTLPDLHIAMSNDEDLLTMVQDFAAGFSYDTFDDPATMNDDIVAIMYQWAGVQDVDPDSRGEAIDARKLEFLEHLFGEGFVGWYYGANPYYKADTFLAESFHIAFENVKAALLIQSGAAPLFTDAAYDQLAGTVTGDLSLVQAAIDDLATHAPAPGSANIQFWLSVTGFIDNVTGLANLTGTEEGWLDDAISSTDIALSWTAVEDLYNNVNPGSTSTATTGDDTLNGSGPAATIDGLAGHDTINGTNGNDVLYGNDGNDTIHGYIGADVIHGDAGNDSIYGESGDDTLVGGDGNDVIDTGGGTDTVYAGLGGNTISDGGNNTTYVFGGGNDLIHDYGGTDQIVLPAGIVLGDLTFLRTSSNDTSNYDLTILVDGGAGGSIQMTDHFYFTNNYRVETLVFDDTSTLNLGTLTGYEIVLTSEADSYSAGTTSAALSVHGMAGNDVITTDSGNDTLDGGEGNDDLRGYGGDDTYVASVGFDLVTDGSGTNTLNIDGSYVLADLIFSGSANNQDLLITIPGLGQVKAVSQLYTSGYGFDYIHFASNNTTVALSTVSILQAGTGGSDTLYGAAYGVNPNDILDGREGNDYLYGYGGDDIYVFQAGHGTDYLSENLSAGADTIKYVGVNQADIRMWTDTYGYLHLENRANASDVINVAAYYTGSGISESTVGSYVEQVIFGDSSTLSLTGGLPLEGTSSGESLYGTAYGDTLKGMAGVDNIYANGGNDTLIGGLGDDNLQGYTGNDTYEFSAGDGADSITENTSSGTDTIKFVNLNLADIRIYTDSNGGLHLVNRANASDSVYASAWYTGSGISETTIGSYVEQIVFSDTSTLSLTGGLPLEGTSSTDSLYGTAYADTLIGLAGSDALYGNGGNDTLYGGDGDDSLYGFDADDIIDGGSGNDGINGGSGNDTASYASATSSVTVDLATATAQNTGGAGTDSLATIENLIGSAYNDTLTGDGNANVIEGGAGDDTINGAGATDTVSYASASAGVTVNLATATGQNTVGAGTDTLSNFENLTGSAFGDTLTGDANANVIDGGYGDDVIEGAAGNDTLTGGAGTDTLSYKNAGSAVTANLATATAQNTVGAGTDTISGFENLIGSAFNDTLTGDGSTNFIEGGAGNDTMNGAGGTDTLSYASATAGITMNIATATAQATGGAGSDTVSNFENILGSGFNDTLTGNGSSNVIEGGAGNDTLNGAGGTDTLSYEHATSGITINLATATAQATGGAGSDTISNFENILGSAFNDTLTGNTAVNIIDGGAGNDTIQGGTGNDTLIGGLGTDTLTYAAAASAITVSLALGSAQSTGGAGTDTISGFENLTGSASADTLSGDANANVIDGGAGNDTIDGGAGNDTLTGGSNTDTVTFASAASGVTVNLATASAQNTVGAGTDTISGFENLTGSAYADVLTGDSGANTINGGDGDDTIQGGAGNDTLTGGNGTDTLSYAAAASAVTVNLATATAQNTVGAGSDTISGFENLTGSAFNDTLTGNSSANTIHGGTGTNSLTGGGGADIFAFDPAVTMNNIQDFSTAQGDKLDISSLIEAYDPLTHVITDWVQITTSGANSSLFFDADGIGSTYGLVQVASILGVTGLTDEAALVAAGTLIV